MSAQYLVVLGSWTDYLVIWGCEVGGGLPPI